MPVTDIVTRLDPVPDVNIGRQPIRGGQSNVRDAKNSTYREALSRSINDAAPPSSASKDNAPANQASQNTEASPRPTDNPQNDLRPTDNSPPQTTDAPNNEAADNDAPIEIGDNQLTPAPEADSNQREFDYNALAALTISTELAFPSGSNPDSDIFTLGDQIPTPPLNVSLLFNASSEEVDSFLNASTESVGDGEPLAPPTGLFESVVSSTAQSLNELPAEDDLEPANTNTTQALAESAGQNQSVSSERESIATGHTIQIDSAGTNVDSLVNNVASENAFAESGRIAIDNPLTSVATGDAGIVRTSNESSSAIGSETSELQLDAVVGARRSLSRPVAVSQNSQPTSTPPASATTDSSSAPTQDNGQIPQSPTSNSVTVQSVNPTTTPTPLQTSSTTPISGQPDLNPVEFVERVENSIRLAQQDGQQLRIKLSPPHLGSLQIEVTSRGGTLSVRLEVQTAAAQTALADNMPALRDALIQSGMSLERIEIQLADPAADDAQPRFSDDKEQQQTEQQSQQNAQQDLEEEPDEQSDNDNPISAGLDELDIQV